MSPVTLTLVIIAPDVAHVDGVWSRPRVLYGTFRECMSEGTVNNSGRVHGGEVPTNLPPAVAYITASP